ncbi:MAG: FKBP-type peptidyl-prolyl cis-trans isomerase [bacterium]|nr:FKBP-type peptidyl-prolyl cis-trans isomerase [bacterium]
MTARQLQVGTAVVIAVAVIVLFFIFNPFAVQNALNPINSNTTSVTGTNSLVVQDEVVGTGATAQPGDLVSVNYTGKLENGTVFDTSVGKNPFQFTLGNGDVIPGWDQGLAGMKVGGKRLLIIPPMLGYGAADYGPIPGNSTLMFEVELLKLTPAANAAPMPEGPNF